jgi:PadR family transcriptional regulator PadR
MNVENTQSQMRKGILEYCILGILHKGEAYPSEILEKLRAAQLLVVEGTVYPLLTRLKNFELLTYRWEESTSGPPRKYYSITTKGSQFFTELSATWLELQQAVSSLTQN